MTYRPSYITTSNPWMYGGQRVYSPCGRRKAVRGCMQFCKPRVLRKKTPIFSGPSFCNSEMKE